MALPSSIAPHSSHTVWKIAAVVVILLNVAVGLWLSGSLSQLASTAGASIQHATLDARSSISSLTHSIVSPINNATNIVSQLTSPVQTTPAAPVVTSVPSTGVPADPSKRVSITSQPSTSSLQSGASYQSNNWAGYVATGASYTGLSGSWTVPNPTNTSATGYSADAAWIGIGGVTSSDLIQVGTTDILAANGSETTAAFYELLPANASYISTISVSPGDHMSASITETSMSVWTITITDTTNGESYTNSVNYQSSNDSAEWIEEAPTTGNGSLFPLDNFGSITFSGGSAVANGKTVGLDSLPLASLTMTDANGNPIATPTQESSNAFSVQYNG